MQPPEPDVIARTAAVSRLFDEADRQAAAFRDAAGMHCPPACGACCSRPGGVEARVAEMLPAAFQLLAARNSEHYYERALADPDGRCVFFVPTSSDGSRGHCAHYAVRPGLCRLFGHAGARDKHGKLRLSTCGVLRRSDVAERVDAGELKPPGINSVGDAVSELVGSQSGLSELLPINRALAAAMTRAFFANAES